MNAIPATIAQSIKSIEAAHGLKFSKKVHDALVLQLAGAVVCGAADFDLLDECIKIITADFEGKYSPEEEQIDEVTDSESDA